MTTLLVLITLSLLLTLTTSQLATSSTKCKLPLEQRLTRLHPHLPEIFHELMLPMRDNVSLHTIALSPLFSTKKQWPTVIDRSPYGEFNTELLADLYLLFDFAAVSQDMRGCCQSEGNFTVWHADENDGIDTINWIVAQPWSNGVVFEIGASADGIAAFEIARGHPAQLAGQFIIFATAEARRTFFPGGTYRANLIEKWLKGTVPKQAEAIIQHVRTEEAPGPWWDAVEIKGDQFGKIDWPTVHWAGWFDIFLHGHLYSYDGFQKRSSLRVQGKHWLVVDPCGHCQDAAAYFPHNLLLGRSILPVLLGIQLFQNNLTNTKHIPEAVKHVTFYVMSTPDNTATGNYWTSLDDFPTPKITPWYMHGDGTSTDGLLSPDIPTDEAAMSVYDYDPEDPTPSNGGNNLLMKCGPLDQRDIENRSDVLVFTSSILTEPLAITGELDVDLHVSSSNVNDTDFAVRLTDVHPDGTSQLIQDGIQRMRWRQSAKQKYPMPMVLNTIYKIRVSLWNTSFVFPKGHQIRVSVSSANHPRFEPNPNTGVPLTSNSTETIVAHNIVHHDAKYPSCVRLPVVNISDLPKHNILDATTEMMLHFRNSSNDAAVAEKMLWDLIEHVQEV